MIILVFGLPGSGKTTFSKKLANYLGIVHINADEVRKESNDWDFTTEGRIRQAKRMKYLSSLVDNCILDFVCPTNYTRELIEPDASIWMNTIDNSRFKDTDNIFEEPNKYNFMIMRDNYVHSTTTKRS